MLSNGWVLAYDWLALGSLWWFPHIQTGKAQRQETYLQSYIDTSCKLHYNYEDGKRKTVLASRKPIFVDIMNRNSMLIEYY
jgi:hypothetical protein